MFLVFDSRLAADAAAAAGIRREFAYTTRKILVDDFEHTILTIFTI